MDKRFKYAEGIRIQLTRNQSREIKRFYKQIVEEINSDVEYLKTKENSSNSMKRVYLENLSSVIKSKITNVDRKSERLMRTNIDTMAEAVIKNNDMFINSIGFKDYITNPNIRIDMANRILTGQLYGGKWNLSSAIWGDNQAKLNEINSIVAKGILENRSTYDIAKDLQRYVNPLARKKTDWNTMYPGARRKIDYNAQRLARTMVQHAYQETFVRMTKNNPFIEAYKWITSGGPNVCAICIDREESDQYGLGPGIFPKGSLPLDHPNGMCTFETVSSFTDEEIAEAIADWYNGEGDENMNRKIDKFILDLQ